MITFNNMITLEIPGLSHDKIMAGIKKYTEKYTKGWRLVFKDAKTEDSLFTPFWGYEWDGSAEQLKELIIKVALNKETGRVKHHFILFCYDGVEKAVFSSRHRALYSFVDESFIKVEVPMAKRISQILAQL